MMLSEPSIPSGPPATVRLAIVGSGSIARVHAEAIAKLPGAVLAAVCSRNAERAEALAKPFGAKVYSQLPELVADWEVEGVLIATPSGLHLESALPALRAGKHVLCEKPIENSSDRARRMVEAAESAGVVLAGFFPLRQGEGAKRIREAIDGGRFGRLTFLSARVKWWREEPYYGSSTWRGTRQYDGGGALMNQGIHSVDLLLWFGGRVAEVAAFSASLVHPAIEVEDTLAAAMRFENGALGSIEAATSCHPGLDLSLEISGDRGTAILENDRLAFWKFSVDLPEDEDIRSKRPPGAIRAAASDPTAISCEGHRQQILDFCGAIRGGFSKVIDGREATGAVAVIEAVYASAKSFQREPVPHWP